MYFSGDQERSRGRSVSCVREGSLLKRARLRQTAAEGCTRWLKFERCYDLEDGTSQNWGQGKETL